MGDLCWGSGQLACWRELRTKSRRPPRRKPLKWRMSQICRSSRSGVTGIENDARHAILVKRAPDRLHNQKWWQLNIFFVCVNGKTLKIYTNYANRIEFPSKGNVGKTKSFKKWNEILRDFIFGQPCWATCLLVSKDWLVDLQSVNVCTFIDCKLVTKPLIPKQNYTKYKIDERYACHFPE